jgi:hypothetical protein
MAHALRCAAGRCSFSLPSISALLGSASKRNTVRSEAAARNVPQQDARIAWRSRRKSRTLVARWPAPPSASWENGHLDFFIAAPYLMPGGRRPVYLGSLQPCWVGWPSEESVFSIRGAGALTHEGIATRAGDDEERSTIERGINGSRVGVARAIRSHRPGDCPLDPIE